MKITDLANCPVDPEISPEHIVENHTFVFLVKGAMNGFDGRKNYSLKAGECCMVIKNHLQRHSKKLVNGKFEKIIISFNEAYLKEFKEKHGYIFKFASDRGDKAFLCLPKNELFRNYVRSLIPYYKGENEIDRKYENIKREELLLILLETKPELADILFDFGYPKKIDLGAFMQKNYKFNVPIQRLAFLSGRSLSTFKRDFTTIYNDTPSHWLVQRRLEEAHFLLENKNIKPSDLYLELGFEDLSHFSYAFRKKYGYAPSMVNTDTDKVPEKIQTIPIKKL